MRYLKYCNFYFSYMINVILYPTIFIGIFLIGWAITLYVLQFVQPQLTRESDIILSTITSLCGGILFFQGWRLDPLLFTCYTLLVITIILLSLELLQLRKTQSRITRNFTISSNTRFQSLDNQKNKKYSKTFSTQVFSQKKDENSALRKKYNIFLPRKNKLIKPRIYPDTTEEKS